jgi:hypothetical protein
MLHGRVRIIDALGQVEASVSLRRPVSGRIRALKYRTYRLFQASHATRQDREDPPDQLGGLIQQSPKMGTIHDEQTEIGCRHDRRRSGLPIHQAHLTKTIPWL